MYGFGPGVCSRHDGLWRMRYEWRGAYMSRTNATKPRPGVSQAAGASSSPRVTALSPWDRTSTPSPDAQTRNAPPTSGSADPHGLDAKGQRVALARRQPQVLERSPAAPAPRSARRCVVSHHSALRGCDLASKTPCCTKVTVGVGWTPQVPCRVVRDRLCGLLTLLSGASQVTVEHAGSEPRSRSGPRRCWRRPTISRRSWSAAHSTARAAVRVGTPGKPAEGPGEVSKAPMRIAVC